MLDQLMVKVPFDRLRARVIPIIVRFDRLRAQVTPIIVRFGFLPDFVVQAGAQRPGA